MKGEKLHSLSATLKTITIQAKEDYEVLEGIIRHAKANLNLPFTSTVYYRELVKENTSYTNFADGILSVVYDKGKEDARIRVDQCRSYTLPKDENVVIELATPLNIGKILNYGYINFLNHFSKDRKNYHYYFFEGENKEDFHTLRIEPRTDIKRDRDEFFYYSTLKIDGDKNLKEVQIDLDTTGNHIKSALGYPYKLLSGKVTLSFKMIEDKNRLSFIRAEYYNMIDHNGFKQLENYVSEVILLNLAPGAIEISKKEHFNRFSLFKAGTSYHSNFWETINMPLLTEEEQLLLTHLEHKGTPVKVD